MSYHHFTAIERGKIEELNKLGLSSREIAERVHCHRSNISRELKRFANPSEYAANAAQEDYASKRETANQMASGTKNWKLLLQISWN